MTNEQREFQRKLKVLEHAKKIGNVNKACRYFGMGRSSFYRWQEVRHRRTLDGGEYTRPLARDP